MTGFLGAGKTTLLNHIIQTNKQTRYAIIENEFGEKNIDNELVINPENSIIALNNGCLCCSLNDNLYDILNDLHGRKDEFDEVIIEATGVADPSGLAQPFVMHPLIKKHFPLINIICLVDAELIEDQLQETKEAMRQITFSDLLLINKTDLVSEAYADELAQKLQVMNPLARIIKGNKNMPPKISWKENQGQLENIFLQQDALHTLHQTSADFPVQKPHSHHHTQDLVSHTFTFDCPFDYKLLHQLLFVYLNFQSKELYRMKGLVWLEGEQQQVVVQSVGKQLNFEDKRPWKSTEKKQSIIVCIGKNLQRDRLKKMLSNGLSKRDIHKN
ncbi:MAG: GTP-binding protein [Bernardetiaceae bacterium]|nr:GTP-binding protein [Bernardetiaceae bacterium]